MKSFLIEYYLKPTPGQMRNMQAKIVRGESIRLIIEEMEKEQPTIKIYSFEEL